MNLPAIPSADPLVDEQQAALYMALQDAETYAGWLSEKVKDPALATNEEITHCYNLTMENRDDVIAGKIRTELFNRREAQAAGKHNKGPGRKARRAKI